MRRRGLVPEGVLDLRPRLFGVALDRVTTALGAQAPVAGRGRLAATAEHAVAQAARGLGAGGLTLGRSGHRGLRWREPNY
jgi:hypothetical protein